MDPFENLPNELIFELLYRCEYEDRLSLERTCRRFWITLSDDAMWKDPCVRRWKDDIILPTVDLEKDIIRESLALNPSKGWRWLAACLYAKKVDDPSVVHLGWRKKTRISDGNEATMIGGFDIRGFQGWAVYILVMKRGENLPLATLIGIGEWEDDLQKGHGMCKTELLRYEGNFTRGISDGHGEVRWKNGFSWSGNWNMNMPAIEKRSRIRI